MRIVVRWDCRRGTAHCFGICLRVEQLLLFVHFPRRLRAEQGHVQGGHGVVHHERKSEIPAASTPAQATCPIHARIHTNQSLRGDIRERRRCNKFLGKCGRYSYTYRLSLVHLTRSFSCSLSLSNSLSLQSMCVYACVSGPFNLHLRVHNAAVTITTHEVSHSRGVLVLSVVFAVCTIEFPLCHTLVYSAWDLLHSPCTGLGLHVVSHRVPCMFLYWRWASLHPFALPDLRPRHFQMFLDVPGKCVVDFVCL